MEIAQKISHEHKYKNYYAFKMTNDSLRDITNDFVNWKRDEIVINSEKNQFCFCCFSFKTESEISNEKIETMNEFHLIDDCSRKNS